MKAKEVVKALGYRWGEASIARNVDEDRHCSLQELLSRTDFGMEVGNIMENLHKRELEAHWLSEAMCFQVVLMCGHPAAKQLESWMYGQALPPFRKTGEFSVTPQQVGDQTNKQRLEDSLLQTQIECLHEDLISKRILNR